MFRDQVMEHYRVRGYTLHEDAKVRGRSGSVYRCDLVAEGPLGSLVVSFGDAGGFEGPELSAVKRTAQDIGAAPVVASPRLPDPVHRAAREMGVIVLDDEAVGATEGTTAAEAQEPDHPWPDPERPQRRAVPHDGATAPAAVAPTATGSSRAQAAGGLWKHPRPGSATVQEPDPEPGPAPAPEEAPRRGTTGGRFGWLPGQEEDRSPPRPRTQEAPQVGRTEPEPRSGRRRRAPVDLPRIEDRPRRRVLEVDAPSQTGFPWHRVWPPVLYGVVTGLVLFLFVALFL